MRLLIIRHGDPDYSIDSLTEKGWREANLLAPRLEKEEIDEFYASPLGRAQATAKPTLDLIEKNTGTRPELTILEFLREFPASVDLDQTKYGAPEGTPNMRCPWNIPVGFFAVQPEFFGQSWKDHPMYTNPDCKVVEVYDRVKKGFDDFMSAHGFVRRPENGSPSRIYDAADPTVGKKPDGRHKTIAFFCHLGLGNALISAITGIPLPLVWKTFFLPTSSVTTLVTEPERWAENQPIFRIVGLGDVSHLYAGGEPTSSSGLKCNIK